MSGKDDQAAGKAKELIGKVTGDEAMEGEGKAQNLGGKAKEGAHDTKEAVKGAAEGVRQAAGGDGDRA
jgi:uncharacterized protein YjbJ (UPF0337 family)